MRCSPWGTCEHGGAEPTGSFPAQGPCLAIPALRGLAFTFQAESCGAQGSPAFYRISVRPQKWELRLIRGACLGHSTVLNHLIFPVVSLPLSYSQTWFGHTGRFPRDMVTRFCSLANMLLFADIVVFKILNRILKPVHLKKKIYGTLQSPVPHRKAGFLHLGAADSPLWGLSG